MIKPERGEKLENLLDRAYLKLSEDLISTRNTTLSQQLVGEKRVFLKSYELGWGEGYRKFEDAWVELNGRIFAFSFWSSPDQFDSYSADRKFIISSFLSTRPPFTPSPSPKLGRFKGKDISFEYYVEYKIQTSFEPSQEMGSEFEAERICILKARDRSV